MSVDVFDRAFDFDGGKSVFGVAFQFDDAAPVARKTWTAPVRTTKWVSPPRRLNPFSAPKVSTDGELT